MNTQEYKIEEKIKNKIIDWIIFGGSGRIVISKQDGGKFGEDLLVQKRSDYNKGGVYLKVCSLVLPADSNRFEVVLLDSELKPSKDFYLLFVCFDSIRQEFLDNIWMIPSAEFKNYAEAEKNDLGQKILKFDASLDFEKKDKYAKFLISVKELGKICLEGLDKEESI